MTTAIPTGYHAAKILARRLVSPTVVVLDLQVPSSLQFQAGQWVDFMVPPYEWIGGFSPASLPSELPTLTLAIKRSNHPPSQWVHSEESKELGRTVHVQVGGNCVLDTTNLNTQPVVFCAGGIGISPVLGMYRQWAELQLQKANEETTTTSIPSCSFLYSVSTEEELVFRDELLQTHETLYKLHNNDNTPPSLILALTQQSEWTTSQKQSLESKNVQCQTGRRMKEFLTQADAASSFYICGPPAMLDEGVDLLKQRGIKDSNIHFERWW